MARLTLMLALSASALATPAFGQDRATLQAEPDPELRLRRWLAVRADRSNPRLTGGLLLGNGALGIGAAVGLRLASDAPELEWVSVALVGVGVLSLASGLAWLIAPDHAADDLRALPNRPLTPMEIGRFEEVLRRSARTARAERHRRIVVGAGLALASGVGLPILATTDSTTDRGRAIGYGALSGLLIAGLVFLVSGLFESPEEADFREYRRGLMPSASTGPRAEGLGIRF